MPREKRGLGKGLSALLGETGDIDQLRKPVGYVKEIQKAPSGHGGRAAYSVP